MIAGEGEYAGADPEDADEYRAENVFWVPPEAGDIRRAIVEADLVDCMVALPGQLFYSTQIPVCLWFLTRDKSGSKLGSPRPASGRGAGGEGRPLRDRRGETLFLDARKLGTLIDRVHRELTEDDINKLAATSAPKRWKKTTSRLMTRCHDWSAT